MLKYKAYWVKGSSQANLVKIWYKYRYYFRALLVLLGLYSRIVKSIRELTLALNDWRSARSWRVGDKDVATPGVSGADEEGLDTDTPPTVEDITMYRDVIARCNYLGADRPDAFFAIRKGCREMSKPTIGPLKKISRIGR